MQGTLQFFKIFLGDTQVIKFAILMLLSVQFDGIYIHVVM